MAIVYGIYTYMAMYVRSYNSSYSVISYGVAAVFTMYKLTIDITESSLSRIATKRNYDRHNEHVRCYSVITVAKR